MKTEKSNELYRKAQFYIPGGVNSPVRSFRSVGLDPLFIEKAKGSRVFDVDGNSFIDYVGSWGPMILGHADPITVEAVKKAAESGLSFGAPTHLEVELAELICEMTDLEMVRMVSSGTEAGMSVIRAARGYTGKHKIIKFTGCYHGHVDSLLVKAGSGVATLGLPDSPGIPPEFMQHTLLARYNHFEDVSQLIEQSSNKIAAIILEPIAGNMGLVTPQGRFLQDLRALCDKEGILLIFDEVMSGFRVARGGAQELYEVQPDLIMLGKVVGGGLPLACYGGRRDIMLQIAPVGPIYQAGTLSGNPLSVTAGIAVLKQLQKPRVYDELGRKSHFLTRSFIDIAEHIGVAIQAKAVGGMFGFTFSKKEILSYEDALCCDTEFYSRFFKEMLSRGIYLAPSAFEAAFMSLSHTDEDLEKTIDAFQESLQIVSDSYEN